MKIKLTKLKHRNGKPVTVEVPKLPKGFRASARKAGRQMRAGLSAPECPPSCVKVASSEELRKLYLRNSFL